MGLVVMPMVMTMVVSVAVVSMVLVVNVVILLEGLECPSLDKSIPGSGPSSWPLGSRAGLTIGALIACDRCHA